MHAFLLGAGFNADAAAEVGDTRSTAYPLGADLVRACFGPDALPPGASVEDLFAVALERRDLRPVQTLSDLIMDADHALAFQLRRGAGRDGNSYLTFLQAFASAPFLTFNYDSLVETLLLSLGRWRPDDGYGVPVAISLPPFPPPLPVRSTSVVLHLHGTLCVCAEEYRLESGPAEHLKLLTPRPDPLFVFDPDSIPHCFPPFGAGPFGTRYHYLDERIIAPILDKAPALSKPFVSRAYARAAELFRAVESLVAIGYRFGRHDRASYHRLLAARRLSQVVVVSPEADEITTRMAREYSVSRWVSVPSTFAEWVRRGFPGLS